MRELVLLGAVSLSLSLVACSSNDTTDDGAHTTSSSSTGSGGAGGAATCDDPSATPDMACGDLSFAMSDVKSRKTNHHVTFLADTDAGHFVYVIGGTSGNFPSNEVDRFPLSEDGVLSAFDTQPSLPVAVGGLTGGIASNVIVVGGGTKGNTVVDRSFSSVIGSDGSLGPWVEQGSLLHPRMHPAAVVRNDVVYVMGGFDDPDVWDDIVSGTVSPDGTVSAWTPAGTLPGKRSHMAVTKVGDYVYMAGGLAKSAFGNPPDLKEVWRGHFAEDGTLGEWVQQPDLPIGLATHASFFYGGYLYVGGGISFSGQEKRLWRAAIDADHNLGDFEETASLLIKRGHVHQLPVFKNHVYSFGGALDYDLNSTDEIDVGTFE